jgi:hypothetical protein
MNRFNKYLTTVLLFLLTVSAYAQQDSLFVKRNREEFREKPAWTEKITFGGNFGLQFGRITQINVSPLIGYRITDKFVAGGGPSYIYTSYKYSNGLKVENTILGGRVFAQHIVFENLAVRGEFEYLSIEYPIAYNGTDFVKRKEWVANPLIGLSYNLPLGRKSSFNITALYNLNYRNNLNRQYLYGSSPLVIRAGFML